MVGEPLAVLFLEEQISWGINSRKNKCLMHIYTLALNLTHVKEASVLKECKTHDANCYLFMFSHKDIHRHTLPRAESAP